MTSSPLPTDPPIAPRVVACPACGGDSLYAPGNAFRPFCSARCKNLDFGSWAAESYRVAAPPPSPDEATGQPFGPGNAE